MAVFVLLYWLIGILAMLDRSDFIVDQQGIRRSFFGFTLASIYWDNIRVIIKFPISDVRKNPIICYSLYPKKKPGFRFTPSGKFIITNQIYYEADFIGALNYNIVKHGINVVTNNGFYGK
jgi:hypothetical protein